VTDKTDPQSIAGKQDFPVGGGECGRLIRKYDWSQTRLGPISKWPQWMRTSVDICLQAPIAIVMLFGPEGVLIYNDAYAAFAGQRHPKLMGMKVLEAWPEAADLNRQVRETCCVNGETLSLRNSRSSFSATTTQLTNSGSISTTHRSSTRRASPGACSPSSLKPPTR
jgi:hypothetical protein